MRNKWNIVLFINVLSACAFANNVIELGEGENFVDEVYGDGFEDSSDQSQGSVGEIRPSVYKNVKRYYCSAYEDNALDVGDEHRIIFAANEWRFLTQDVNLTLSFPTSNAQSDYVITSMEVFLFYDGSSSSQGYLTSGGMGLDHISMEFIIPQVSRLYYQFQLQGVKKTAFYPGTFYNSTNICNQHF